MCIPIDLTISQTTPKHILYVAGYFFNPSP
jgi:hypothetical protein